MSPNDLAALHPRLYHITKEGAWDQIAKYGLLSTEQLLLKFEIDENQIAQWTKNRRDRTISISHPRFGQASITDNCPLSEKKLSNCLDNGLQPSQWLEMLNRRVFFWVNRNKIDVFANSRGGRKSRFEVLEFDTLSLVSDNFLKTEITPINTGSTIHVPARRGTETFSCISQINYNVWRRKRKLKKLDQIAEVTVLDGISNPASYLLSKTAIS